MGSGVEDASSAASNMTSPDDDDPVAFLSVAAAGGEVDDDVPLGPANEGPEPLVRLDDAGLFANR